MDITAKYIPASLVTVSRIFDLLIPWRLNAMNCVCMRTNARTRTSKGTDRGLSSRNGEIRKSGGMVTKEERENHPKHRYGFYGLGKT